MTKPDLSEFYQLSKPRKPPCQLGMILSGDIAPRLSAEDAAALDAACKTDRGVITASAIQAWLAGRGHEVNTNRISTHRRGVCTCGTA